MDDVHRALRRARGQSGHPARIGVDERAPLPRARRRHVSVAGRGQADARARDNAAWREGGEVRMGPHACGLCRRAAPRGGAIRALGRSGGANARIHAPGQARAQRMAGFTLLELIIALMLLALMSAVMFGSLSMAGRTWDGGEAKVAEVSAMRQAQEFLREQLAAEYPLRMRKVAELPLLFAGERDEMRYAAALPPRVVDGGV